MAGYMPTVYQPLGCNLKKKTQVWNGTFGFLVLLGPLWLGMIGSLSPSESRLVVRAVRVVWNRALCCQGSPSCLDQSALSIGSESLAVTVGSAVTPHQVTWFSGGILV